MKTRSAASRSSIAVVVVDRRRQLHVLHRRSDRAGAGAALRPAGARPHRRAGPLRQSRRSSTRSSISTSAFSRSTTSGRKCWSPTTSGSKSTPSCATASTIRCGSISRCSTCKGADAQLGGMLNSALRRTLSEASITDIVRNKRDALMADIRDQVKAGAERFGLDVVDVRIKRADLPPENSEAVFRRMQAERQRLRRLVPRARARSRARQIKADADAKVDRDDRPGAAAGRTDPRRRRRRAQPHLRRGLRRGSRVLRLLSLDAGL